MYSYEELYGVDADGNRGMMMRFYELEDSDTDEIVEQLQEMLEENGELSEKETVYIFDSTTEEEVEIEVDVDDYEKYLKRSC